jgi:hypothetical protein
LYTHKTCAVHRQVCTQIRPVQFTVRFVHKLYTHKTCAVHRQVCTQIRPVQFTVRIVQNLYTHKTCAIRTPTPRIWRRRLHARALVVPRPHLPHPDVSSHATTPREVSKVQPAPAADQRGARRAMPVLPPSRASGREGRRGKRGQGVKKRGREGRDLKYAPSLPERVRVLAAASVPHTLRVQERAPDARRGGQRGNGGPGAGGGQRAGAQA